MKRRVFFVGTGMGNPGQLTCEAKSALEESQLLIGAPRLLEEWNNLGKPAFPAIQPEEICKILEEHSRANPAAILFSGDIGFYSGAKRLRKHLQERYELIPFSGISSPVYFCDKLGISWQDVKLASAHGRDFSPVGELLCHPKVFLLTGGKLGVRDICRILCQWHMGECVVHVGERLSYPDECISHGTADQFAEKDFAPLSVMLMENTQWRPPLPVPGLPDDFFIRGEVPMTKSEVRCVSLSRLGVGEEDTIWDIGAGTGSVSIEAALLARRGFVYAVEREADAVNLIRENRAKAGTWNLRVVEGEAPKALLGLPAPDGVFLGGSGRKMKEILSLALAQNPQVRVVINAITLETLAEGTKLLETMGFEKVEVTQISATRTRKAGPYHMMQAQNPVFILSGTGRQK